VLYQQGNYSEAEKRFKEASQSLPQSAAIQYHLGLVAHRQGRNAEAITALRRALLLEPGFDEAAAARRLIQELGG
jgi:Tfp pilus assembly protein PilF